jgi:hypothetical protein
MLDQTDFPKDPSAVVALLTANETRIRDALELSGYDPVAVGAIAPQLIRILAEHHHAQRAARALEGSEAAAMPIEEEKAGQ